ncbi:MAG TPA: toxin-antitoxin system YwqK family antitoxin [Candidatus Bathyarchaeia archaeon]|nr:toxin-antitoxin system YwqK family antitoxin [Candidatus Bathyarchaeia archaeon]
MSKARYSKKRKRSWRSQIPGMIVVGVFIAVGVFIVFEAYRTQLLDAFIKAVLVDARLLFLVMLNVFLVGGGLVLMLLHWVDWENIKFKIKQQRYHSRLISPDYYKNIKRFDLDDILSGASSAQSSAKIEVDHTLRHSDLVASDILPSFGQVTEIGYRNGKLDGLFKTYLTGGSVLAEISYRDGKLNGPCFVYYPNGNRHSEKNFVDGKLNGIFRAWDEDGALFFEIECKNDLQHGYDRIYRRNGTLEFEDVYVEGRRIERKTFDESGQVKYVQDVKMGEDFN